MQLSKQALAILEKRKTSGRLEIYRSRKKFFAAIQESRADGNGIGRNYKRLSFEDLFYGHPADIKANLHSKRDKIVYFHGGAHVFPIFPNQIEFVNNFGRLALREVLIPRMPLAPEFDFEEFVEFIKFFFRCFNETPAGSASYALMGDSSGAGRICYALHAVPEEFHTVSEIILISPWLDLLLENPKFLTTAENDPWIGIEGLRAASEMFLGHSSLRPPDLKSLARSIPESAECVLVTGTRDLLFQDSLDFAKEVKELGKLRKFLVGEELFHSWMFEKIPESTKAIVEILPLRNSFISETSSQP